MLGNDVINMRNQNGDSYWREIYYLISEDRKKIPLLCLYFLLISMFDVIGLGLVIPFISMVSDIGSIDQNSWFMRLSDLTAHSLSNGEIVSYFGLLLISIFIIKGLAGIYVNGEILKFGSYKDAEVRARLMNCYQEMEYLEYTKRNSAEYIQTINQLVPIFQRVLIACLRISSEGLVTVLILILLAVNSSTGFVLLLLLLLGSAAVFDKLFGSQNAEYGKNTIVHGTKMVQIVSEGIMGLKEIRVLGKRTYFYCLLKQSSKKYAYNHAKAQKISASPRYVLESIAVLFVVSFAIMSIGSESGTVDIFPTLSLFAVATMRLMPSASQIMTAITHIRNGRFATLQIYSHLSEERKRQQSDKVSNLRRPLKNFQSLALHDVSFSYPEISSRTLSEVNMTIMSGDSIGIIGATGSGKTTLIDIMLGLLKPESGHLLYNGERLGANLSDWRSQIAYLPQEVFLVDDSIRNNIALGVNDENICADDLESSLQKARLDKFVKNLPEGVETIIGENGVRISGGQRQRIALARAFYHKRSILVMDESTSALDTDTENEIVEEINMLKGKITTIVISHRESTLEKCDYIYRIVGGKVNCAKSS